jgi:hypothetical protein
MISPETVPEIAEYEAFGSPIIASPSITVYGHLTPSIVSYSYATHIEYVILNINTTRSNLFIGLLFDSL